MNNIHPTAIIYPNVTIDDYNVTIGPYTVIGGPAFVDSSVKSCGVIIENSVTIGANCTVVSGTESPTIIQSGTMIDDHVHIAHDCFIGSNCRIAAQCGLAGFSRIGLGTILAGQVGVKDRVTIGNHCIIGAKSGVHKDIKDRSVFWGNPAREIKDQLKIEAILSQFPKHWENIKDWLWQLEEKV